MISREPLEYGCTVYSNSAAGETEGGRRPDAAEQAATANCELVDHAVASAMVPA